MNLIEKYINSQSPSSCLWISKNLKFMNGIGESLPVRLTRAQYEILDNKDKHKAYFLPRQTGKTFLITSDSISRAVNSPGERILIAVATPVKVRHVYLLLNNMLTASDLNDIIKRNTTGRIEFMNGSIIKVMHPTDTNVRGERFDSAYIDDFESFNQHHLTNVYMTLVEHNNTNLLILGSQHTNETIDMSSVAYIRPTLITRSDL